MKRNGFNIFFIPSYAQVLEKTENLANRLRWASNMNRSEILGILQDVENIREELVLLTGSGRFRPGSMPPTVRTDTATLSQRRQSLIDRQFQFDGVFGKNPRLIETLEIAEKAARTDLPVLICGESGTGKELLARVVHRQSPRNNAPFVSVNCGAIPPTLLESELFGHVRGAFTGSFSDRKGKFEAADKGSIFLDEISELPHESQVKLLRTLQNGDIHRVGADEAIRVDTRIIAATNRNLFRMTRSGEFREDLYYRLSVIGVTLPPLRERRDEIPPLIEHFAQKASEKMNRPVLRFSPELIDFLMNYSFPGNIRELENIIYRLQCLSDGTAFLWHLPDNIRPELETLNTTKQKNTHLNRSLEDVRNEACRLAEKAFLEEHLKETKGNVSETAKRLQMNRSYLQTLLKKRGIKAGDFKKRKKEDMDS